MATLFEVLEAVGVFLAGGLARLAFVLALALLLFIPLLVVVAAGRGLAALLRDGHLALPRRRHARPR